MAKPKKELAAEGVIEQKSPSINGLRAMLQGYKEDHFNFIEARHFNVSTGSLILDSVVSMGTGIHRLAGFSGSGKTSESFQIMKNTFETVPNSKGFYVKAEGRLSKGLMERSGVKFVFNADEWVAGTCFVFECNIFETIADILEQTSKTCADSGEVLVMVIDSMDALMLKNDSEKKVGDNYKTAGPQALMKKFLARMALPIDKYGHICLVLSQVSSSIKIDPYAKELPRAVAGSGGFGLTHFSNYILEFEPRFNGDMILENPSAKFDHEKNKAIGHWVVVSIKKSDKETQGVKIKYPVKYGQSGGNSIWLEYELADYMLMYGFIEKKGPWFKFDEELRKEVKEATTVEMPEQVQGSEAVREFLEENQPITKFLFKKFKDAASSSVI